MGSAWNGASAPSLERRLRPVRTADETATLTRAGDREARGTAALPSAPSRPWLLRMAGRAARLFRWVEARTSLRARDPDLGP
jgi:hypothetical protein